MAVRPERVPAEEVRQRMLDAGRDLALEVGAALTIEHLRLEEVIQRARVPRSSVYRMWPYRENYIDDLLSYLAGAGSWFSDRTVVDPETLDLATRVLADNRHLLATPEGRLALMREVVRVVTLRNYESLSSSAQWRLHMALATTLGSTRTRAARQQIAAALEGSQRRTRDSIVTMFDYLSDAIGFRMRDPDWSASHMQLAGGLLVQSMALRNLQVQAALGTEETNPEETDSERTGPQQTGPQQTAPQQTAPDQTGSEQAGSQQAGSQQTVSQQTGSQQTGSQQTGPARPGAAPDNAAGLADATEVDTLLNAELPGPGLNGKPARWTLSAFAYLGIIEAFIELDPDFVPPAL